MVDTGLLACAPLFARLLRRYRPDALLLTHHHLDHRGGAFLAVRAGVPLRMHALDVPFVTGERFHGAGLPSVARPLLPLHPRVPRPAIAPIEPGDELLGHTVLHLPGHTHGQVGLLLRGGETALVADALISRDGRAFVPRAAYNDDHSAALATLHVITALPARTVLSSHGDPLPMKAVRDRLERRG